ncbi:MAG: hypothetical protein QNJ60_14225 [Xenococcaceae cyanobacterium MO_188.B19]|nr:hypothetical protein [Xenococcaceae cyanobacterium MO_188.B19]
MVTPSCSLWIMVARTDVAFMMHTIPHLVRMSNFPFEEKVLAVDTAPLSGEKVNRPGVGTMEELRNCTQVLLQRGVIDRIVDINYDPEFHRRVFRKHFGSYIRYTHNYKGYPILGSIFKIEDCRSEYMIHFDSDMLLHQQPDYSWIQEGIELMNKHETIMSIRPLTGPPASDETMKQYYPYTKNSDGFYEFKFFGSRVYMINCQSFAKFLPIPAIWRSYRNKWLNHLPLPIKTALNNLTKKGALDSWEIMVSRKLEQTNYIRATLCNPCAWTLHPKDRSAQFIQSLPQIIERIEQGDYPAEQAGHYDLIPHLWY